MTRRITTGRKVGRPIKYQNPVAHNLVNEFDDVLRYETVFEPGESFTDYIHKAQEREYKYRLDKARRESREET